MEAEQTIQLSKSQQRGSVYPVERLGCRGGSQTPSYTRKDNGVLRYIFWLLLGIPILPQSQALAAEPKPFTTLTLKPFIQQAGQYALVEMHLETDGAVNNPFDLAQADLRANFTSPSGKTFTVPAFWYQDFDPASDPKPDWRVRFTPSEAGNWMAQAELVRPALKSEPIQLKVEPRKASGFVRINKQNPRYFAFDNGAFFLPIGLNIAWSTSDVLDDYERWLRRLSENGGNIARVWMASWSFGLEWGDTGLGDYTKRLRQAWLLDRVFKMAEERGVYIMLCLLNHGAFSTTVNAEWDANPYNAKLGGPLKTPDEFVTNLVAKDLFKRRLRYIAARYAANTSLFAWEWWNEVNWTPIGDKLLKPWIVEMTEHLVRFDPYQHLVSSSYSTGPDSSLWQLPQISFAQQHDYTERDLTIHYAGQYSRIAESAPNKPLLPAELAYSASGAEDFPFNRDGLHLHNGVWAPVFTGYAGTGMYWWWDKLIDPKNLWPTYKGLTEFVKGDNLALLEPSKPILSNPLDAVALGLQNQDRALVWIRSNNFHAGEATKIYTQALLDDQIKEGWQLRFPLVHNLNLTVKGLNNGVYRLRWFNPRTAAWIGQKSIEVKAGEVIIRVPNLDKDIAVKLERTR